MKMKRVMMLTIVLCIFLTTTGCGAVKLISQVKDSLSETKETLDEVKETASDLKDAVNDAKDELSNSDTSGDEEFETLEFVMGKYSGFYQHDDGYEVLALSVNTYDRFLSVSFSSNIATMTLYMDDVPYDEGQTTYQLEFYDMYEVEHGYTDAKTYSGTFTLVLNGDTATCTVAYDDPDQGTGTYTMILETSTEGETISVGKEEYERLVEEYN